MRTELSLLSARIAAGLESIPNEATTISSLVHPFIAALGYNHSDPKCFVSEYVSDFTRKGDSADCAILKDGKPIILFECKYWRKNLSVDCVNQLRKYFSVHPSAKLGILTNGIEYRFYTDSVEKNIMDAEPFLAFDLSQPDSVPYNALKLFSKSNYTEKVFSRLSVVNRVKNDIIKELNHPYGELARIIFSTINISPSETSDKTDPSPTPNDLPSSVLSRIRSILAGTVAPERLVIRSSKPCWCSIAIEGCGNVAEVQFSDNGKKWLAMNILDGFKQPIKSLDDLPGYSDQFREAAKMVDRK